MAKSSPLINNFAAGEFGPLARARVDLDRYSASQELCQNAIARTQGGLTKREGSKYVANAKTNTEAVRLEPFIFSNGDAYMLEFGAVSGVPYVRFYKNGAQILDGNDDPYELAMTFGDTDRFALSFNQINDIVYITTKEQNTVRLTRFEDDNWSVESVKYHYGPYRQNDSFADDERKFLREFVPSAATGTGVSLTPSSVNLTAFAYNDEGYLQVTLASDVKLKVGERVLVRGSLLGDHISRYGWITADLGALSYQTSITSAEMPINAITSMVTAIMPGDVGNIFYLFDTTASVWGRVRVVSYQTSNGYLTGLISVDVLDTLSNTNGKYLWRSNLYAYEGEYPSSSCFHDDRLYFFGPGLRVNGSVVGDYENFRPHNLSGVVADNDAINITIASNESSECRWGVSDEKGILVGTSSSEFLIRSSSTQTPITPTSVTAKRATSYGSKAMQPVQAGKAVIFGQASGRKVREFNYFYDVDGFRCSDITQLAHHICDSGIKQISMQKQPEQTVWCSKEDGVLIGVSYERDLDGLRVSWHRHVVGGVSDAAGNPAIVESVACVPTSDNSYDEVWLVVKRYVNGQTVKHIEYIGQPFTDEVDQEDVFFVDSGLSYNSPVTVTGITKANPAVVTAASHGFVDGNQVRFDEVAGMAEVNGNIYVVSNKTANTFELNTVDGADVDSSSFTTYVSGGKARKLVTTLSGLGHLEGQSVQVCADGADAGEYTVLSGAITLDNPAAVISAGLKYQAKVKLQRLEAGSQDGTALGKTRRIHRLAFFLHRTLGLKFGQNFDDVKSVTFQDGDDQLNQASPLFSGIVSEEADFQYDFENHICILHDYPTPMTLLAIMPQMNTQDR